MDICRELEQKYDLIPAVKGQQQEGGAQARIVDYPRGNVKQQVSSAVRYVLQNYRFSSQGKLNTLLKLFNVSAEQMEGTVKGNPYSGVIYQAMKDGEPAGKPFKSSLIGRDVGFKVLQKKYADCKGYMKTKSVAVERLKGIVGDAMQCAADPNELARLLGEEKIHVIMHRAKDGRIHGVTFIDHQGKLAVNGSRLGKAFSAARFEDLYGNIKDFENSKPIMKLDYDSVDKNCGAIMMSPNDIVNFPDCQCDEKWVWPDENTIWEGNNYDFDSAYAQKWCRPVEEYTPDLSDPFTILLEGAATDEPFEELPSKRHKRKYKNRG